jgi:carbonic anhydrase/acetyltransferase-like protein (isoleucine patch superfamily)
MAIYGLRDARPAISASAFVAPNATLIGRVTLGHRASVWFGAVLRADNEPIVIGAETSIQESAVLHADPGFPLQVGERVTVGHQAMLHGCTVGDGSLVGVQAVVLNGARIGKNCLVGAGAIVTEGKAFPDRSLILGAPAKVVRELTDDDMRKLAEGADDYVRKCATYRDELHELS